MWTCRCARRARRRRASRKWPTNPVGIGRPWGADGRRTASLRALTDYVVAVVAHDQIDRGKLAILAGDHRREEQNRDERK